MFSGGDLIYNLEKYSAAAAISKEHIPKPSGEHKDHLAAVIKHFGLEKPEKVDDIFIKVRFPSGWEIRQNERDPRIATIMDANKNEIGYTFYKASGYDRYGYTNFNEKTLKELGILS